ncbi:unnamed protein product [Clavelina lepadiformis]|uniref:Uncharacterized protein n=1 Tax=Clavelina lepadiformis TaxID=159417 RepID=A0ABP0F443_CLALP
MGDFSRIEGLDWIKIVVVGDAFVGKSSMIHTLSTGQAVAETRKYEPTDSQCYYVNQTFHEELRRFQVIDIGGAEACESRSRFYSTADVFLVTFSIHDRTSFENVISKWIPRVCEFQADAKILLVGLKSDKRTRRWGQTTDVDVKPIQYKEGTELSKNIKAAGYVECSALTKKGIRKVFAEAV